MLDWIYPILLVAAGLVFASVMTSLVAFRFGAPLLLVFLGIGLLAGEDGLGIRYDDAQSAYLFGSLALSVILFDSGFGTRLRAFRQAAVPALTLASLGVIVTALLVGVAAAFLLGLPWFHAFLLGSIVGSTDAAAVFFLLRAGGITIRENVRSLLEVESGSNDPMAIFLTVTFVELIVAGSEVEEVTRNFVTGFAVQMGLGILAGLIGGYVMVEIANRIRLEGALYPIGIVAGAVCLFAATGQLGGSGFLAVYIAGLVAGNSSMKGVVSLQRLSEGMTWMAQIAMFLILGLLATPSEFVAVALPAIAIALVLILIARPLAVWLCLIPFGYKRSETAFVAWVGLRGSVSILLAIIPLAAGLEDGQLLFNAAYIVVLASLLAQGWTIRPMAKWLELIVPPRIGPVERVALELPETGGHHELIAYHVVPNSPVLQGQRLPRWARPSLVVRDGRSMRYQFAGRLRAGDHVYMFIPPSYTRLLDRLFASPKQLDARDKDFFGAFSVDPKQPMSALAQAYDTGTAFLSAPDTTIGAFIREHLGGAVEVGDRVPFGQVELIVRDVDVNGSVTEVGLAVEQESAANRIPLFLSGREIVEWIGRKLSAVRRSRGQ